MSKKELSAEQTKAREQFLEGMGAWTHQIFSPDGSDRIEEGGLKAFDIGTEIKAGAKMTKKAERLVSYFLSQGEGYCIGYGKLVRTQWAKWEGKTFKTADVLSMTDVKKAIAGLYLKVTTGEYKWVEGKDPLMLMADMDSNGGIVIRVKKYIPNLYTIKESGAESDVKKQTLLEALEKLAEKEWTDAESKVLQDAIAALKK